MEEKKEGESMKQILAARYSSHVPSHTGRSQRSGGEHIDKNRRTVGTFHGGKVVRPGLACSKDARRTSEERNRSVFSIAMMVCEAGI